MHRRGLLKSFAAMPLLAAVPPALRAGAGTASLAAAVLCACAALHAAPVAAAPRAPLEPQKSLTAAEILANSSPADWRPLDPQNTLYLELATGRVVIELMPQFAPRHVANVTLLARTGYFDGLFLAYLEALRNRHEAWFKVPAGHVDVCNVPIPARPRSGVVASR